MKIEIYTKNSTTRHIFDNVDNNCLETNLIAPLRQENRFILKTTEGSERSFPISDLLSLKIFVSQTDRELLQGVQDVLKELLPSDVDFEIFPEQ